MLNGCPYSLRIWDEKRNQINAHKQSISWLVHHFVSSRFDGVIIHTFWTVHFRIVLYVCNFCRAWMFFFLSLFPFIYSRRFVLFGCPIRLISTILICYCWECHYHVICCREWKRTQKYACICNAVKWTNSDVLSFLQKLWLAEANDRQLIFDLKIIFLTIFVFIRDFIFKRTLLFI